MATSTSTEASRRLVAARRYKAYNQSAPGANLEIIDGGLKFGANASACRVTVALTTSSVLNVTATDGTTEHKWGLNASAALNAADLYSFTFAVLANDGTNDITYNLEVETDGVIEVLIVDEIQGAVT